MAKIISIAGALSAVAVFMALGAWVMKAEDSHEQVDVNTQFIEALAVKLDREATAKTAKREQQEENCRLGDLPREKCLFLGFPSSILPPPVSAPPPAGGDDQ
jgi:hypothetical protein